MSTSGRTSCYVCEQWPDVVTTTISHAGGKEHWSDDWGPWALDRLGDPACPNCLGYPKINYVMVP